MWYSVLVEHPIRLRLLAEFAKIQTSKNKEQTMKTIAVIFAFCLVGALALTDEQKTKLTQHKNACITETGVDAQVVDNAKAGNFAENDEKLDCFSACMLKKIGIMGEDGSVNFEVAKQRAPSTVPKEQVESVINKCKDSAGPTDCKKAANLVKCFVENKSFNVFD